MFDKDVMEYILSQGMIDFTDRDKAYSDMKQILHIMDKISDIELSDEQSFDALSTNTLRPDEPSKADLEKKEFFVPKVVQ